MWRILSRATDNFGGVRHLGRNSRKLVIKWRAAFLVLVIVVFTFIITSQYVLDTSPYALDISVCNTTQLTLYRTAYDSGNGSIANHNILTSIVSWKVPEVDCAAIFRGDQTEISHALQEQLHMATNAVYNTVQCWKKLASNCQSFQTSLGYTMHRVTEEESEFPLAFSILYYKDVEQVEQLLRAIYRPQNVYCLHADRGSGPQIAQAMQVVADCFPNVFMASQRVKVRWGTTSVLDPELVCMKDLVTKHTAWKYFINLTGQEYPLKTNLEIVRILKMFNGTNDVSASLYNKLDPDTQARIKYIWVKTKKKKVPTATLR